MRMPAERARQRDEVGPKKLDHELRCKVKRTAKPAEGQHDGYETPATHSSLQVPGCAGAARESSKTISYPAKTDRGSGLALADSILKNK